MAVSTLIERGNTKDYTTLDSNNLSKPPTTSDEAKAFRDELTLLKSYGVKLVPANLVAVAFPMPSAGDTSPEFLFVRDLIRAHQLSGPRVGLILEANPLSLTREYRMLLEASSELRPELQRATITPYELRVDIGKDGKLVVEIRNWLLPEDKSVIFKRTVSYSAENSAKLLNEVIQGLNSAAGNPIVNEGHLDKVPIDKGTAARWSPSLSLFREMPLTAQQEDTVKGLLSKTLNNEIYIDVLPSGKPVDYYVDSGSLPISEACLVRNGFSPIQVDRILRSVTFMLPMSPELKGVAGKSYRDKFGNRINCSSSVDGSVTVSVQPRIFFSGGESPPTQRSVNLDLTSLGLGTIENFIYQKEVPLVSKLGSKGQYSLYSTCTLPEENERIPKLGGGITAGTSTAERLFGFAPGSLAKNIVVMPSDEANAHFSAGNPDTVFVYFPQLAAGQSQVVGCHEAIHLISHRFGVSRGEWKEWFDLLKKEKDGDNFLTFISESVFSSNIKDSGHAYSDEEEFLASFVNGFRDTNWTKSVGDWPLSFKVLYKDSLLTLDSRLETLTEAYKNSALPFNPVLLRAKIKERLGVISKMIFGQH